MAVFTAMPLLKLMQIPETIVFYFYSYIITIYCGLAATVVSQALACVGAGTFFLVSYRTVL